MQRGLSASRQQSRRFRPPRPNPWPLRFSFLLIALLFVGLWWAGSRAMYGKVSFAWAGEIQRQAQAVASPLQGRGPSARNPNPTPGQAYVSPLAQSVPPTAAPSGKAAAPAPPTATPAVALVTVTASPTPPGPTATPSPPPSSATPAARSTGTPSRTAEPERSPTAPVSRGEATAEAEATALAGPHVTYVVQAGDTLYGIAREHGTTVSVLATMNHLQAPYKLLRGMHLLIPAG